MVQTQAFIEKYGLWTDDERRQADEIKRRIEKDDVHLVRIAWADPYGASRAKALTTPAFMSALTLGFTTTVATSTLDSAGARTFSSFTRGGGMELPEMTGSPNIMLVPDPATFRVLPWAPGVGWVLFGSRGVRDGSTSDLAFRLLMSASTGCGHDCALG